MENYSAGTPRGADCTSDLQSHLGFLLCKLKNRAGRVIDGNSDHADCSFPVDDLFRGYNRYGICNTTGAELVNTSSMIWDLKS